MATAHMSPCVFLLVYCQCAVASLNAAGLVPICYFSTQYENWRPDNLSFPASALGSNLDNWGGERYVDTRRIEIRNIMAAVGERTAVLLVRQSVCRADAAQLVDQACLAGAMLVLMWRNSSTTRNMRHHAADAGNCLGL